MRLVGLLGRCLLVRSHPQSHSRRRDCKTLLIPDPHSIKQVLPLPLLSSGAVSPQLQNSTSKNPLANSLPQPTRSGALPPASRSFSSPQSPTINHARPRIILQPPLTIPRKPILRNEPLPPRQRDPPLPPQLRQLLPILNLPRLLHKVRPVRHRPLPKLHRHHRRRFPLPVNTNPEALPYRPPRPPSKKLCPHPPHAAFSRALPRNVPQRNLHPTDRRFQNPPGPPHHIPLVFPDRYRRQLLARHALFPQSCQSLARADFHLSIIRRVLPAPVHDKRLLIQDPQTQRSGLLPLLRKARQDHQALLVKARRLSMASAYSPSTAFVTKPASLTSSSHGIPTHSGAVPSLSI